MLYTYRSSVVKVIDGDTVDLQVSLGFEMYHKARFRLVGINTPESFGKDACDAGRAAKQFLIDLLPPGTVVVAKTSKDKREKYGRMLAELFLCDADGKPLTVTVNQTMIDRGHAKAYDGGAR
jgi:micrococcal nuclease